MRGSNQQRNALRLELRRYLLPSPAFARGSQAREPAEAPEPAFQFHGLTVCSAMINPVAPNASAERAIVPRLPGSWRPTATMSNAGVARSRSCNECVFTLTNAAIPCGVSDGTVAAKTSSGTSKASVRCASRGNKLLSPFAPASEINTVENLPARADGFFPLQYARFLNAAWSPDANGVRLREETCWDCFNRAFLATGDGAKPLVRCGLRFIGHGFQIGTYPTMPVQFRERASAAA